MVKINYLQLISLNMLVSAVYSSNPNSRANQGHFSRSHSIPRANNNSNREIQRNLSFDIATRPNQSWLDATVPPQHGRIADWSALRGHSYPNDFAANNK